MENRTISELESECISDLIKTKIHSERSRLEKIQKGKIKNESIITNSKSNYELGRREFIAGKRSFQSSSTGNLPDHITTTTITTTTTSRSSSSGCSSIIQKVENKIEDPSIVEFTGNYISSAQISISSNQQLINSLNPVQSDFVQNDKQEEEKEENESDELSIGAQEKDTNEAHVDHDESTSLPPSIW